MLRIGTLGHLNLTNNNLNFFLFPVLKGSNCCFFTVFFRPLTNRLSGCFFQSEQTPKAITPNRSIRTHPLVVLPEVYASVTPTYAPRRGLSVQEAGDRKVSSEPTVCAALYSLTVKLLSQNCSKTVANELQAAPVMRITSDLHQRSRKKSLHTFRLKIFVAQFPASLHIFSKCSVFRNATVLATNRRKRDG